MTDENIKPISNKEKSELSFKIAQTIQQAKQNMVANAMIIGKCLYIMDKHKLYRHFAEHLTGLDDFLDEMRIKKSTGYHYLNIYKTFGDLLENGLAVSTRRLIKLLPVVNKENREEWVRKAAEMTESDFDKEINIAKGKDPDACSKDCPYLQDFKYCPVHRRWWKI